MGVARGRSCASILVVPRRKTTLVRALHGRASMAGVGASREAPWGSSPERGERGKERGRGGRDWGGRGAVGGGL
jgi:hypothetical protein